MAEDWTVTVTGEVVRIARENIDKSGRNPRFNYTFFVAPASEQLDAPAGVNLPAELPVRVSHADLAKLTDTPPVEGDRVTVTARGNGPNPRMVYMTSLRKL